MTDHAQRSAFLRQARYETLEDRLALSAQPLGDFFLTSQVEQQVATQLDQLEQHVEELQELDRGQAADFTGFTDQLEQQLSDVHDATGVNYVHNTYGLGGAGQTVAVIDSGIAWDHVALGGGFGTGYRVVGGWDFAENDADPYDDGPAGFHGTHVSGIIGSSDSTYKGVAPDADLVGLRVFDDSGAGTFAWVESALQWVHDNRNSFANPITTVNMSLGTTWNADTIPNWTTLEDELSQLEQDGIFIAVSAGNSFANYNTPGLSYPAASSYVTPVASVTNSGGFSSFSQRNARIIAAPGSSITSTVPDHVFGADGNPNDFATASGTSMASPYVAGAAVLVRQAMEFVGVQNITQETLYNHIRNTADVFYDAATSANYYRLNVQSALDALMSPDDYGSTANTAQSLGALSGTGSFSGRIGTTTDQDFFTFVAGNTGAMSFTANTNFELALNAQVVGVASTFQNNVLTFDVVAGSSYTVSFGTDNGIGDYSIATSLAQTAFTMKAMNQGGQAYSLDSDGWLSVNGQKVWSQTQGFSFGGDGSLYWLSTNGTLQHRTSQGWQNIDSGVTKYTVLGNNAVYALGADNVLSINGQKVWSQTQDFSFGGDGSLYWLSTNGMLQHRTSQGWQNIDSGVVGSLSQRTGGVSYYKADGGLNTANDSGPTQSGGLNAQAILGEESSLASVGVLNNVARASGGGVAAMLDALSTRYEVSSHRTPTSDDPLASSRQLASSRAENDWAKNNDIAPMRVKFFDHYEANGGSRYQQGARGALSLAVDDDTDVVDHVYQLLETEEIDDDLSFVAG